MRGKNIKNHGLKQGIITRVIRTWPCLFTFQTTPLGTFHPCLLPVMFRWASDLPLAAKIILLMLSFSADCPGHLSCSLLVSNHLTYLIYDICMYICLVVSPWAHPQLFVLFTVCLQLAESHLLCLWPAATRALGAMQFSLFMCWEREVKERIQKLVSFHLSRITFLQSDFITVIKELWVCRMSGAIAFESTKTLPKVKWWTQLNHGNFTSVAPLHWCGHWEEIECCCIFCYHLNLSTSVSPLLHLVHCFLGLWELSFLTPIPSLFILPEYVSIIQNFMPVFLCGYYFPFHVRYPPSCFSQKPEAISEVAFKGVKVRKPPLLRPHTHSKTLPTNCLPLFFITF